MATKKRVLSAKQKAELAKGRAKMAAKRGRKKLTPSQKKATASSVAFIARKSQAKGFTDTAKKKARRISRRKQNTEPGYFPNPIKTVYLVGAKSRVDNKKGYFNGSKKLNIKNKAQEFENFVVAKQVAANLAEQFLQFQFFVETVKKK